MTEKYDVLVIGGGPGGYVAGLRARQLGLTVAIVEKERIGGVCLNRGCIPTKALCSDVEGLHWARRGAREGVLNSVPNVDFSRLMQRKDVIVDKIVFNLGKHIESTGIKTVLSSARILEPGVVTTAAGDIFEGRNVVVATGARSWKPPIPGVGLPGVLTTREILNLDRLPSSLVIIGGGIIGQEFASIFSALGCRVTILEVLDRILYSVDSEFARKYSSMLPARGIISEVSVNIGRIERGGEFLRVIYEKSAQEKVAQGDLVLMATGRRPVFDGLGLEELGLDLAKKAVPVDRFLRTSVDNLYAIGDVLGRKMLAHEASYHGEVVAENIAGRKRSAEEEPIPNAIFTEPLISWVGLTEQQALKTGRGFRTSTVSLASNAMAMAMGESTGWVKLIEDSETRRLIGAHLMGARVVELVGEMTLAIKNGMSASDIADVIHPHPTISESLREAALGLIDGPIHSSGKIGSFEKDGVLNRPTAR